MNQLQVLEKLIPIYTEAINRIANEKESVESVLTDTNTGDGICWCIFKLFDLDIEAKWIDEVCEYKWWYKTPEDSDNPIECISYRLTIMQMMVMDLTKK